MELTAASYKKVELSSPVRIPFAEPDLGDRERKYLNEAYDSGWISGSGSFVKRFEERFAKFIGVEHAITCSNGTAALQLAYHACGMNGNSKVVVPANTFRATYNMARLFTNDVEEKDSDKDTWNLNLNQEADFVVGVHLYGNPCDMGGIYKQKFTFIEDCAQSLGSKFKGKMCGSYGRASTFSFHSAKMITTGEGGMVCTNDEKVAERVRHLKNQAMTEPYKHTGIGYNFRMTNLQAALGLAQLERIKEFTDKKQWMTDFYNKHLSAKFIRQKDTRNSHVIHWANAYRIPNAIEIKSKMSVAGIETRPGFVGDDIIMFPCSTKLTEADLRFIVKEANEAAA